MSPLIMYMDILHASLLAIPGVPQKISATEFEVSRPIDTVCIIVVQWDLPANSDGSDIAQYIVYNIPSRNIRNSSLSSTLITTTRPNCGDDIRIQVAAVNRVGCVGMNSSEVQPVPLDIPTARATTEGGSNATTEGGSGFASTSSKYLKIIVSNKFVQLVPCLCRRSSCT